VIRVIGNADEFWRVRVTRLDDTEGLDFEWHEDILYRQPKTREAQEAELWHVEAIRTDDPDIVARLGTFESEVDAREFAADVTEDLAEMTKSEFELAYVDRAELGDTGIE
jgi:hypothetical protein